MSGYITHKLRFTIKPQEDQGSKIEQWKTNFP
jgi:hypothetical protein